MINVTDAIKQAYDTSTTQCDKIILDNIEYAINNVQYSDDCYNEGNIFGTAIARTLQFEIENIANLEGKEFEYLTGIKIGNNIEWISLGNFIVESVEPNDTTNINTVNAMDYMLKSNVEYISALDYSSGEITILNVLQEACTNAGLELGTIDFPNKNFIVDSNQFEQGTLIRQVIQAIAQISGSVAKIKNDNKLYLINPNSITKVSKKITLNNYSEAKIKRATHPINLVSIGMSDVEGENIVLKDAESIEQDGENSLVINDNPFAYTQEKREQLITALFNTVKGFEYKAFLFECQGLPYLETMDKIQFEDKKGNVYNSYVFRFNYKSPKGLESEIEAPSIVKATVNYQNVPSALDRLKHTEFRVDKAEGKIAILAEEQGEIKEQIVKSVENIEGMQTITLPNCVEGNLLEFYIYGHNTDFNMLVPNNDLYPSDDLFPVGSGVSSTDIYTIKVENEDGTKETYDLGEIVLLSKIGDVQDEYVLRDGKASVVRRIDVENVDIQEDVIEELGEKTIFLKNGTNTITLLNYNAKIRAKYVVKNTYTDIFATKSETNAQINIKAAEVSTEVNSSVTGAILTLLNNGYLTAEQVNSLVEGNTEEIATIKKQLKQTVTDSQMQIAISTAIEGGVSYFKNTLFTINEQGMWIATSEDEFNALYNNKGMYLYSYEQMIAKFDVNGATLNNLKVLGTIETPHSKKMAITVNGEDRVYDFWVD